MPESDSNLLSISSITKKGFQVNFSNNACEIKKGNNVLLAACLGGKLYKMEETHKAYTVQVKERLHCIHEWHKILGHRNYDDIRTLEKQDLVKDIKIKPCIHEDACEICFRAKGTRLPFPKANTTESKGILELVHADVCGSMDVETPSKNRYVLTVIDDYSRYTTQLYYSRYTISNKTQI